MKLSKRFYIVQYGKDTFYLFYTEWTIKRFLWFKYVSNNGMSYAAFPSKKEAQNTLFAEKMKYIHAKRMMK